MGKHRDQDPEYNYFAWESAAWGALVSDEAFSFKGQIGIVRGVRVTGCVHNWEAGSWNASRRQILAYGSPTTVKQEQETLPAIFDLRQNYPNPFNNCTLLILDLPTESFVQLNVYDLNGRIVENLAEGEMEAGRHAFRWSPRQGQTASGILLCRMTAQNGNQSFAKTIKMSMIK